MPSQPIILPRTLLAEVFKDPRTLLAVEAALQAALVDNPSSIQVALTAPNFVGEFNGVGDSATNNDAAFTAAEASTFAEIYLPDGEFVSTLAQSAFQKHYIGPGKIVLTGVATMPGRFSYIATTPTIYPTQGQTGFFRGNTDHVDPEWHVIGPGTRDYLTNSRYFEAGFIPHPVWFDVNSGASGWIAVATVALHIGDISATFNSTDGLVVGATYGLTPNGMAGAITDTIVIDTIVGAVITFHPPLTTAYPAVGPPPAAAAPGYAVIMRSLRTWAGVNYNKITNTAAGDCVGSLWRLIQNYVPKAGQTHFFETSTVTQGGGDVNFGTGSSGTFAVGFENGFADNGEDVAVNSMITTFTRTNDTGARSVVWMGTYFKSDGTKPSDVAHAVSGKWRIGLDTVRADLTTFVTPADNLNCAINTALGHRWIMNSTASAAARGGSALWGVFYGNVPGDMYLGSGNDGSDFIEMRFNRAAGSDGILKLRPNAVVTNVPYFSTLGMGLWGSTAPGAQPAVTGALSTVTDAAAKAVLTSIIAALTPYGLATNGTT